MSAAAGFCTGSKPSTLPASAAREENAFSCAERKSATAPPGRLRGSASAAPVRHTKDDWRHPIRDWAVDPATEERLVRACSVEEPGAHSVASDELAAKRGGRVLSATSVTTKPRFYREDAQWEGVFTSDGAGAV